MFVRHEARAIGSGSEGAQSALEEGYRWGQHDSTEQFRTALPRWATCGNCGALLCFTSKDPVDPVGLSGLAAPPSNSSALERPLVKTMQEGHVAEGGGGAGAVGPQAGHGGEGEDSALPTVLPVCSSLTRGRCRTPGERISSGHGIASSCYAGAQEHRWRTCLVWYLSSS